MDDKQTPIAELSMVAESAARAAGAVALQGFQGDVQARSKGGKDIVTKAILAGTVALSPVTDLTLSGASYETLAQADPLFTRQQVADLVRSYL